MKVLITGSKGFLGKNLAEYLSGKFELLLPGRKELDLLGAEAVKKYLDQNRPDVVIHAAGVGITRGENTSSKSTQDNLKMFYNLAESSSYYQKMIFCGSGAVYDKRRPLVLVKEAEFGKRVPADPYGTYKYECSQYIEKSENMIDLRMFGVFGKYEDYATRFISNAICRAILGMPINIIKNVNFEYLYVADWVKIVEHFITSPASHKAYNVGTGKPVSLLQLAEKIKPLSGKDVQVQVKEQGMANEYTCDNARLMAEMSDFKFTPLDIGLKELYNWYSTHINEIDSTRL